MKLAIKREILRLYPGMDTLSIAERLGLTEAEVWTIIARHKAQPRKAA